MFCQNYTAFVGIPVSFVCSYAKIFTFAILM